MPRPPGSSFRIARDIADEQVSAGDFGWIVVTQTVSYLAGAVSWIFAERAGFGAFGRYMLHFARQNRFQTALLADNAAREQAEPFLTGETFHICFDSDLTTYSSICALLFNCSSTRLVLGIEIDAWPAHRLWRCLSSSWSLLQWLLRKRLAAAYLHNQRMTNRMTARTYNAWDNIFSGNRYNFALWHRDFRQRLNAALVAQVRAILAREGWSALSGVIALIIVLSATAWVAMQDAGNTSSADRPGCHPAASDRDDAGHAPVHRRASDVICWPLDAHQGRLRAHPSGARPRTSSIVSVSAASCLRTATQRASLLRR